MSDRNSHPHVILRCADVAARTGLSRSSIYELVKANGFPPPIPIGVRAVGWLESEVDEWIEERIRISRSGVLG